MGDVLLELLGWDSNCHALLASGHAVPLVQRLDTVLDNFVDETDKSLGKLCPTLDTLLQVSTSVALRPFCNSE